MNPLPEQNAFKSLFVPALMISIGLGLLLRKISLYARRERAMISDCQILLAGSQGNVGHDLQVFLDASNGGILKRIDEIRSIAEKIKSEPSIFEDLQVRYDLNSIDEYLCEIGRFLDMSVLAKNLQDENIWHIESADKPYPRPCLLASAGGRWRPRWQVPYTNSPRGPLPYPQFRRGSV